MIQGKFGKKLFFVVLLAWIFLAFTEPAFAQSSSEADLRMFLDRVGDFLIGTIGPGMFVIGLVIAGISTAMGEDAGTRRGLITIFGGAMIMLARAVLDWLKNAANF